MPKTIGACLATLAILTLLGVVADAAKRVERVRFNVGDTTATVSGRIKGDDGVSYELGASQGQVMSVSFAPENPRCHFNVLAPGSDTPMHDGSLSGNEFSSTLSVSGDYVAEVYLMLKAAQRNELCDYNITFKISG